MRAGKGFQLLSLVLQFGLNCRDLCFCTGAFFGELSYVVEQYDPALGRYAAGYQFQAGIPGFRFNGI